MTHRRSYWLRLFPWLDALPEVASRPKGLTAEVISTLGISGGAQRRPLHAVLGSAHSSTRLTRFRECYFRLPSRGVDSLDEQPASQCQRGDTRRHEQQR